MCCAAAQPVSRDTQGNWRREKRVIPHLGRAFKKKKMSFGISFLLSSFYVSGYLPSVLLLLLRLRISTPMTRDGTRPRRRIKRENRFLPHWIEKIKVDIGEWRNKRRREPFLSCHVIINVHSKAFFLFGFSWRRSSVINRDERPSPKSIGARRNDPKGKCISLAPKVSFFFFPPWI